MPPLITLKIIENMDKIIFNRYHALIFSILKNKPFLCYDPYGKEKYQSKVGQLLKEFEPIVYLPYDPNNQNLEELFFKDIEKIGNVKRSMKKRARNNFDLIEKILDS